MLEQSKYQINKVPAIGICFLVVLFLLQSACFSDKVNQTKVTASSNEKSEVASTPQPRNYLTQENLTDISKLVERYQSATEKDKEAAQKFLEGANEELKKGRSRVAAGGFLESASVFPTVEALVMAAECNAQIDETDHPEDDRLKAKTANFNYSVKLFETAKEFAEKTGQNEELKKYPDLEGHLSCLKSFINRKDEKQTCEYVKGILRANKIN